MEKKEENKLNKSQENKSQSQSQSPMMIPPRLIGLFAEEVARTVASRLPNLMQRQKKNKTKSNNWQAKFKKLDSSIFLDTSAIIDGRIFDVFGTGLLMGNVIILYSILSELKHIADSQDAVKRERGRKGLEMLEKLKKAKGIKVVVLSEDEERKYSKKDIKEVDDRLIIVAKNTKSRVITCDYNLEKKASIQNVTAVNVNALAHVLKITAVPGESLHIKVLHQGKDITQGVGYLDDGTMVVVESARDSLGQMIDVVISRVIQTTAGRILFAKKI